MRSAALKKSGLRISVIGFGGLHIATKLNQKQAADLLNYAFYKGINFFDTARCYFDSEKKIGEAFKNKRDKVFICTKSFKRNQSIIHDFEISLKHLNTHYLDIFMFHGVDHLDEFEEIQSKSYSLIQQQKEKGRLKYIGISSHSPKIAKKILESGLFHFIEFPLNCLNHQFINEGLDKELEKNKIGFFAMKPFGGGILSNAQLALNFIRQYNCAVPLIGFENKNEIDQVLEIYEKPLLFGDNEKREIEKINKKIGFHFCRGCEYCRPCPEGINTAFLMYYPIQLRQFGYEKLDHPQFNAEFKKFDSCSECGECETKCPYNLPILKSILKYRIKYEKMMK